MLDRVSPKLEDGAPGRGGGRGAADVPPPGEDGVNRPYEDELENAAQEDAEEGSTEFEGDDEDDYFDEKPTDQDFLKMVTEAKSQAQFYSNQVNRRAWERAYKAYRQEHFSGSKYTSTDFRNRSKLFIPKTRSAIRKDMAATMKSVFDTVDVIEVSAGNEADQMQRGSAAVLKELINYRTDRANARASMPWFHTVMGSRQTALMTGFVVTKQHWKLEMRRTGVEDFEDEETGETRQRDVWKPWIDRPDCVLISPENITVDPACDWTNPAQDSAYFIIDWPMRIDEIKRRQHDPRRPWNKVPDAVLRASAEGAKMNAAAIRRSRDQGLDRFEQSSTGPTFDVIWVSETYIRTNGEDWTFFSVGDQAMLTDPAPVREVYPEQDGERPITFGYGSLEAFCIFPMAAAESWQMLQQEVNDVRNLTLDAFKQNVMPVTKVRRGRQIDLDQLKRRGQGSSIMVTDKDDVTWENPPQIPAAAQAIKQQLDIDFDDLAGQANYGTVQDNNALGKTLGGLKLAAGAANAVQEYDIRVWIETWAERALSQIAKLEQFYESDPQVLGLVGERAQLWQKHGIDEITDELLENSVSVRISIGPGAGDPDARLQKFAQASTIAQPFMAMDPRFASGEFTVDGEAVAAECFGAAGFRDGGKRFIKKGEAKGPDPAAQAKMAAEGDEKKASAELKKAQARKTVIEAMVAAADMGLKIEGFKLDGKAVEFDQSIRHMDQMGKALELGHSQGLALKASQMAAKGLNVDGSPIDMPGTPPGADYPDGKVPPQVLGAMPPGYEGASADPVEPAGPDAPAPAPEGGAEPFPMPNGMPTPPREPAAAAAPPTESAPPKKARKIKITGRSPDGRASNFEVED